VPTKAELVAEIGAVLRQVGAKYALAGTRDKHYGIWIFSLAFDEARNGRAAALQGLRPGPEAVFRGKPSDLDSRTTYTYAQALGAKRDWEIHVDVNMHGVSGVTHGIDVSVIPERSVNEARTSGRPPRLSRNGLGVEAKCFGSKITPNEGRVTLGFQLEMESVFWLVATTSNAAVEAMLRTPGRKTGFFGDASPGSPTEAELRRAFVAHLNR
jgi:hypothetical protein